MKSRLLRDVALTATLVVFSCIAPAQTNKSVRIGMVESSSGDFLAVGLPVATGVRLAVKQINERGGFQVGNTKYTVELVDIDNRSDGAAAVAGALKLVQDQGIRILFGPTSSNWANQVKPITVKAGALHFSAASLWQVGGDLANPKQPLLFGTQNPVGRIQDNIADAVKKMGGKKVAILGIDDDTTASSTPGPRLKQHGFEVEEIRFPPGTTDFSSYLTRLRAGKPDVFIHWTPQSLATEVFRLADSLKVARTGYGALNVSPSSVTGLSLTYASMNNIPSLDYPSNPRLRKFAEELAAFEPKLQATRGLVFYSYDFVFMVTEAMKKAGTTEDTMRIAEALRSMTYGGVAGKICFLPNARIAQYDQSQVFMRPGGKIEAVTFPSPCK